MKNFNRKGKRYEQLLIELSVFLADTNLLC